jgi:hypothetical protein
MTAAPPLWTIMIASVYARTPLLDRLLKSLSAQIEPYAGRVGVLVDRDNCEKTLAVKRTELILSAAGEYVCFIDDDDDVARDYVPEIVRALEERPDYVGFQVRLEEDRVQKKPVFHSIRYPCWSEDADGYYRHVTHLNPIRKELAEVGLPFSEGYAEDHRWSNAVFGSGRVTSEVVIDKVMYHYRFSSQASRGRGSLHVSDAPKTREWSAHPEYAHVEYVS